MGLDKCMKKCDLLVASGGKPPYACTTKCLEKHSSLEDESQISAVGSPVSVMHFHGPGFFDGPRA